MPYGIDLGVSMRSSTGKQASIVVLQASPLLTASSFSTMISNAGSPFDTFRVFFTQEVASDSTQITFAHPF